MSHLLNSGLVGHNKTQKEILARWEKVGFLHGLKGSIKINVANAMERGAALVLTGKYGTEWEYESIFFPVIRRTMSLLKSKEYFYRFGRTSDIHKKDKRKQALKNFNVEYVADSINDNLPKINLLISNMNSELINKLDVEAEGCALFSELLAQSICLQYRHTDVFKTANGKLLLFTNPTNKL